MNFRQLVLNLITLSMLWAGTVANAKKNEDTPHKKIIKTLRSAETDKIDLKKVRSKVGKVSFFPNSWLRAGQVRISLDLVQDKIDNKSEKYESEWNEKKKKWSTPENDGTSWLPIEDAAKGILTPFGIVLIDGHHHVVANMHIGAKTSPVEIIDDYSQLIPSDELKKLDKQDRLQALSEAAIKKLKKQNFVFLTLKNGEILEDLPKWEDLEDDSNRYFFGKWARKINFTIEDNDVVIKKDKGQKAPIWFKINDGIPFIEFYLSQILYENGLMYDSEWGSEPPEIFVKMATETIVQAQKDNHPALNFLLVNAELEDMSNIDATIIVKRHLIKTSCVDVLTQN